MDLDLNIDNDDVIEAAYAIEHIISTSKTKEKEEIVKNCSGNTAFLKTLYYLLNSMITFKMSAKTVSESFSYLSTLVAENGCVNTTYNRNNYSIFYQICEDISQERGISGNKIMDVCSYIYSIDNDKVKKMFVGVITKSLRLGVTAKTVNKVVNDFIPLWEVQQAYPIERYPFRDGVEFTVTQKLNGVRATYYRGELVARSGERFIGLNHISDELSSINPEMVYDGELTLFDTDGMTDNEAFTKAAGIINSDDMEAKKQIIFTVFDALPVTEFEIGSSLDTYFKRREFLNSISNFVSNKSVRVLPELYRGNNQAEIWKLLDNIVADGKEGLMVNLNVPYQCKRHRGILKVKRFYTVDLEIVGFEEGSGLFEGTLGSLIVDYMGNNVNVGSGFTYDERNSIWLNRDSVVGKICEVKYKDITMDRKTKKKSLQFPVFVRIRNDKEEVNYEV